MFFIFCKTKHSKLKGHAYMCNQPTDFCQQWTGMFRVLGPGYVDGIERRLLTAITITGQSRRVVPHSREWHGEFHRGNRGKLLCAIVLLDYLEWRASSAVLRPVVDIICSRYHLWIVSMVVVLNGWICTTSISALLSLSGLLERLIFSPKLNRYVEKAVVNANGVKDLPWNNQIRHGSRNVFYSMWAPFGLSDVLLVSRCVFSSRVKCPEKRAEVTRRSLNENRIYSQHKSRAVSKRRVNGNKGWINLEKQ